LGLIAAIFEIENGLSIEYAIYAHILDASWIVTEETAEFLVLLTLDENLDHVHCRFVFYFPFIKSFRTVTREDFFCLQKYGNGNKASLL
jgi:hypothetical protein